MTPRRLRIRMMIRIVPSDMCIPPKWLYKPAVLVGRSDNPLLVEQSEMITYGSRGRHGIMTITTPLHLAVLSELDSQGPQSPANLNLLGVPPESIAEKRREVHWFRQRFWSRSTVLRPRFARSTSRSK